MMPNTAPAFRRARRCEATNCAEVAERDGVVLMRNSTTPETVLAIDPQAWRDFLAAIRAGEFDLAPGASDRG